MIQWIKSNAVALAALFIALGGTSYAAIKLPRNSVGSAQIRTGAVGASEVRDGALQLRDFAARERSALRGPKGDTGSQGAPGLPGTNLYALVSSTGSLVKGSGAVSASAPPERITGSYVIKFDRDVSSCAFAATVREAIGGLTGFARATPDCCPVRANDVFVAIKDENGLDAQRPFSLIVVC